MNKIITLTFFASLLYLININAQTLNGEKKRFTFMLDGVQREYFLHIPSSYSGNIEVPLVFMLHGTSGDGELMYETSGWAELSEKEGFIAVFPSSMRYKINDNGELKTTTKWHTIPDADWTLQPGEVGKDDIKFLRKVLEDVKLNYKINAQRVYLNGFSNGGQMAAKCSIEMSDVLAAVCSNASGFFLDTVYVPKKKIPFLFQIGNRDYGPGNVGPDFPEVPMNLFDTLISTPGIPYLNGKHYRIAYNCIRNLSLNPEHTIMGDSNFALFTTYYPQDPNAHHEFKYVFVKDLGHSYPNWAPTEHWEWLNKYSSDTTSSNNDGKQIRVVTEVEDVNREYFIHLPAVYDSTKPTPMVMMFHGGGHDGELFYNISGWNEVADTANIIVVYPSALKYCILEDGVQKVMSQWNNGHKNGDSFCPDQILKDDVLFVNTIIQQLTNKFNIDSKRIYTVGFSNGGEFAATRTAIELSDKIAASISCGGGGSLPRDTVLIPKRKLPVMLMFGNKDERMLSALNITGSVPMGFEALYSQYPVLYFAQVKPYIHSFELDGNNYDVIGDTNSIVAGIFKGLSGKPENIFYNVEVKDLEHEYPNGKNHWMHGATYHWKWLNRYTLEDISTNVSLSESGKSPLLIYPNPAQNFINVNGIGEWKIYDFKGNTLLKGIHDFIDISLLNGGLYCLVRNGSHSLFFKN